MKNMFNVTTVLPHNLLQTNPCIRHNFSTQVFRKRAAQLYYVGPELLVPNEEHVQCDHRFASQPLANEPLHSSQLFDTSLLCRPENVAQLRAHIAPVYSSEVAGSNLDLERVFCPFYVVFLSVTKLL